MYDTFSQNWKYFGDEQSVVVKKHWGIRELTHLRVGSSSLVVLLVHGYYQRPAISLAPSNFLLSRVHVYWATWEATCANSQCMISKTPLAS